MSPFVSGSILGTQRRILKLKLGVGRDGPSYALASEEYQMTATDTLSQTFEENETQTKVTNDQPQCHGLKRANGPTATYETGGRFIFWKFISLGANSTASGHELKKRCL